MSAERRRRERTASTSSTATTRDARGPLAAPHEPRRAAAADQRASRRDVPRRAAAVHRLRDGALRAAPLRALPGPAGDHRLLAGHRAGPRDASARRSTWTSRTHAAGRSASTSACSSALRSQLLVEGPHEHDAARRTDEPVRIGVVGLGYWGPNLVRNLHELPEAASLRLRPAPGALEQIGRRYPAVARRRRSTRSWTTRPSTPSRSRRRSPPITRSPRRRSRRASTSSSRSRSQPPSRRR